MRRKIATVLKEMTQTELARIMGITQARVSQLFYGTRGETEVWVHFESIKSEWKGESLTTRQEITKITYQAPSCKTIERKP